MIPTKPNVSLLSWSLIFILSCVPSDRPHPTNPSPLAAKCDILHLRVRTKLASGVTPAQILETALSSGCNESAEVKQVAAEIIASRRAHVALEFVLNHIKLPVYRGYSLSLARLEKVSDADSDWWTRVAKGDEDGDLVPNDIDRCPHTSSYASVGEDGCERDFLDCRPSQSDCREINAGKHPINVEDLERRIRQGSDDTVVMYSPKCEGAPPPSVGDVLRYEGNGDTGHIRFEIKRLTNTIPGCRYWHEIQVVGVASYPMTRFLFPESAGTTPAQRPNNIVFEVHVNHVQSQQQRDVVRGLVGLNLGHESARMRVRAFTAGQSIGPWSAVQDVPTYSWGAP